MPNRFTKDKDAVLDYGIDWAAWLGEDTITTSTWLVPEGLTKDSDSHTETSTLVWLRGGEDGKLYRVTNRVVTGGGRTDDRTIRIEIKEQ